MEVEELYGKVEIIIQLSDVRTPLQVWDLFMKACKVMFIVFNGHQGGSYPFFLIF